MEARASRIRRMRAAGVGRWLALAPLALAALLVALATLQYRWTGELGRAEEERARVGLTRAAAGLVADFDRGLGRLFFHFLQPPGSQGELEGALAGRVESWRRSPDTPELLRQLFLVSQGSDGRWALRAFDEPSARWRDATWPTELAPLGTQLPASGERGAWSAFFGVVDVPALVLPVPIRGSMIPEGGLGVVRRAPPSATDDAPRELAARDGEGSPWHGEGPRTMVVLWLDTDAIARRVLPVLVDRHLGGEVRYHVEVTDASRRRLFVQGPAVAAHEPDVTMPIFRLPLAERFAHHRTMDRQMDHGEDHGGDHGGMRMRTPGPPFDDSPSMRGRWLLSITHPAGSLAAAVGRERVRNLAISFVILALLAAAVGLVLIAARRAEALARQQIELVAGVSHELLTPVAAVRSAGENLAAGVVSDPMKVKEYGELIVREGRRLGGLVEGVLAWAGLQARGEPATRKPVDPAVLVRAVVAACAGEAASAGVELETEIAPGLPPVDGDRDALERALRNLVENALRHGASGGWVGVGAASGDAGVVLAVEDRGPGPDAEDLPHLFEPFYRGRGASTPGSGLGLALARQIAEAHGGRLRVARATPRGARFTLELPGWNGLRGAAAGGAE